MPVSSIQKVIQYPTTAVEDIDRNAPTKTPSEALPPHDCKIIIILIINE